MSNLLITILFCINLLLLAIYFITCIMINILEMNDYIESTKN
jgi:hypothetical protein